MQLVDDELHPREARSKTFRNRVMGWDGIIGENVFVVPVRVLPPWSALFSGFFQLALRQQLLVPVFIGIGRLLSDIGDIMLFIQTEKIPQSLAELIVMLAHNIHLSLYVVRMAQPARTHRHGILPTRSSYRP